MRRRSLTNPIAAAAVAFTVAGTTPCAHAGPEDLPPALQGAGVVERLDAQVPMDLVFTRHDGEQVRLGDYFKDDGRPVILTLNYYRCPMLCSLTLNGLIAGLKDMDWVAGREFDILTVSFAPEEKAELAEVKRRAYLSQYGRDEAKLGWDFLVGEPEPIQALCRSVGFGYTYDATTGEYAHSSTIIFITPDGRISRYMNETLFEPRDLRLALIESSKGAIGSPMERFVLFMCYQYDPDANSYVASAWKIMRLGGVLTILILGAGIMILLVRGPRHADARRRLEAVT